MVGPLLKVVSFNLRFGTADDGPNSWPHRRDAAIEAIRRACPHLLGVQEALDFQIDELLEAMPGHRAVGVGRDDGQRSGEHAAILVDTTIFDRLNSGTFWFAESADVPGARWPGAHHPRICTWVQLRLRETREVLHYYNLHLDNEMDGYRAWSVERLWTILSDHVGTPTIVSGDFNAGEESAAIRKMKEWGLRDTFRVAHPNVDDVGTYNGFRDQFEAEKIDYIFVNDRLRVSSAEIVKGRIDGRWPSDHALVTAEVRIEERQS